MKTGDLVMSIVGEVDFGLVIEDGLFEIDDTQCTYTEKPVVKVFWECGVFEHFEESLEVVNASR